MRHGSPRMILGSGLWIPDITGVSGKLATLQCANNRFTIADQTTGGVDEISAALHLADQVIVEEVERAGMQRSVDSRCRRIMRISFNSDHIIP
jgi:hypothetical protein